MRLTAPWRIASAVSHSRASSRSTPPWTRSSASRSDSPPRNREPLLEVGPPLGLGLGRDDLGRLDRARQPARQDEVEGDVVERTPGGRGLLEPALREAHRLDVALADVAHLGVAHEVQPSAHGA
jgi:hypothetical protein